MRRDATRLAGHIGQISLAMEQRWRKPASAARNDALRSLTATLSPGSAGGRRVSADPLTTLC